MNCCTVYIYNVAVIHVLYMIDKSGGSIEGSERSVIYMYI